MTISTVAEYVSLVFSPFYGPVAGFVLALLTAVAILIAFRRLVGSDPE